MDFFFKLLAGIAEGVAAQRSINFWKTGLRHSIVQWCNKNHIVFAAVAVKLVGARQTNNGCTLIVRSFGILPNQQVIPLFDTPASMAIGEAIRVVYNNYPVEQPQLLFNHNELYAPFN